MRLLTQEFVNRGLKVDSEKDGGGDRPARGARDILDHRYARGEIDRDEYIKRKQDIADR